MSNEATVIIGAGPAGLAAGYELARHGIRPIVLEKADKVGGISRTETFHGYNFDIGGHRFFTRIEQVDNLWRRMLGEDFLAVRRSSRILYRERLFNYPLTLLNALSNLGITESLLIILSYLRAQLHLSRDEDTFEQWMTNRFGSRLYRMFFKEYTEKVWGIPCHELRADWAAQRIKGLSLASTLSNVILGTKKARTLTDEFRYPAKGPGMMWQRFQEELTRLGGQVHLNSEVVRLRCENGRIVSVTCVNENGPLEIPVSCIISSSPIGRVITSLEPEAPAAVLDASRKLKHRSFILVGLMVNKKDLFPDQWIYVHTPNVKVARIQNFKNWSAAMVPDPQKTSVGMEYFCTEGDRTWRMSDAELREMASRELSEIGLAEVDDVVDVFIIRQPDAYPVYDDGYRMHLDTVRSFLESIDNFQTIGRSGMHRYNNMDHSMCTGMLAAQNVLGQNNDLWKVNEEDEYLE